ncbi:MAG TPA: SLBB domain-containing protein, partial [Mucilaginibacter sp.]|nr:SLBB domain-containing protein [Mucilaginibacter sp.]
MNNLKIYLSVLIVVLCFLAYTPSSAQSIPANANIDNYSDAQIKQWMQEGLTDAQLVQMAQSKGMSAEQVQRFQTRIADIRAKNNNGDTTPQTSRTLNYQPNTQPVNQQNSSLSSKIFGSSLFRNSTSNTFQPNLKLATPVNYIVGPGDQLVINVYGNSIANWSPTVTPEGNINIPGVGILNVAGKTIEQATTAIKNKLIASNYAIGNGTSMQVNLGNIRSINVIIQGELVMPGTYTIPSVSTAFDALFAAGGPNDIGSFRQIEIIRNNKVIRHLDLYDFLVKGYQKDNITLQDQDVIHVPPYGIRVELSGAVKIPALFEVLPGETLQDLLRFSGGFTDQAYTALIKVDQINDQQHRVIDVFEGNYKNYIPLRGDKYIINKILNRYENRVIISGAIFRPGHFALQSGLTLSQLIKKAGGVTEDAFTGRGTIIRLNPDNTIYQQAFNVQDVLTKPSSDIPLQREDSVRITSKFELHDKYTVSIKGEVRKQGEFAYADSMKVADLIIQAGGFAEGASSKRIGVARRVYDSDPNVKNAKTAQVFSVNVDANFKFEDINFTLKPFDIVSVYSLPGYETQKQVKVEGEVLYPGLYVLEKKNEKISDIVARAGGVTLFADVDGANLKRNNLASENTRKTKVDTAALSKERNDRLKRLERTYKDSLLMIDTSQIRNNYVGIDLRKILQ